MPMDRRSLLKMFALAPALSLLDSSLAHALLPDTAQKVYILLHGMFFMEYDDKNKNFTVATPNYEGHRFYTRMHGQKELQPMATNINLCDKLVGLDNKQDFDPNILQIYRGKILNIKDPVLSQASMYRCKMILPYPEKIKAIRLGSGADFHPTPPSSSMLKIPSQIATITCLVYSPATDYDAYTESYYAEHPHRPNLAEINMALVAAQDLCGDNFKLQICAPSSTSCIQSSSTDPVSQDDEYELTELPPRSPCVVSREKSNPEYFHLDVASCPQFGINP
jgi:hypothetical protein